MTAVFIYSIIMDELWPPVSMYSMWQQGKGSADLVFLKGLLPSPGQHMKSTDYTSLKTCHNHMEVYGPPYYFA